MTISEACGDWHMVAGFGSTKIAALDIDSTMIRSPGYSLDGSRPEAVRSETRLYAKSSPNTVRYMAL